MYEITCFFSVGVEGRFCNTSVLQVNPYFFPDLTGLTQHLSITPIRPHSMYDQKGKLALGKVFCEPFV